ncbi:MAG TPA: Phenylacetic acid catabolic protein [Planctomycetota bacterium]|nr:Phenylacetic acid catabolic protein [Planctomycetota bacterium]
MPPRYAVTELEPRYHKAVVDWQQKNFKDYDFLINNWHKYYAQDPFRLIAKVSEVPDVIEIGNRKGRQKFQRAHDMKGNMFYTSAAIIKAQGSTEFGSIQQHRETLDQAPDDETRMDILRIMAEELRHGYQMCWVFGHDDWSTGGTDIAKETIDELLSMETGKHVLDSFNIPFECFLDPIVYASVIDRVGKYQLTMQQVFSYKPMAASMKPMLQEESFHMASGVNPLKKIAAAAADEKGSFSIQEMQKHFNKWFARGLEMFGAETGGGTNVQYGFKSMQNGEAQSLYIREVQEQVIDPINFEILKVRKQGQIDKATAKQTADRILSRREAEPGVRPDELLRLPDPRFFRKRGVPAWSFTTFEGDTVRTLEDYERELARSLPDRYLKTKDYAAYQAELREYVTGRAGDAGGAGFRV